MAAKLSAAALVALACLCSAFALLILPLRGTARYVVCGPSGSPLEYAEVEVVDPGAMGRIRYYAVEQTPWRTPGRCCGWVWSQGVIPPPQARGNMDS